MNVLPLDQVERIFACFDDNCSVSETARRVGCARRTATRYRNRWRRARIRGGMVEDKGETVAVRPSPAALAYLAEAAARRGVSRGELVAELLEVIAETDLVASIIGDPAPLPTSSWFIRD